MKPVTKLFLLVLILSACGLVTPFDTNILPTPVSDEYQDFAYQLAWAPDDSLIALATMTGLYVYDTKTYEQLAAFNEPHGAAAVFSHTYLAAGNNEGYIYFYDLESGKKTGEIFLPYKFTI